MSKLLIALQDKVLLGVSYLPFINYNIDEESSSHPRRRSAIYTSLFVFISAEICTVSQASIDALCWYFLYRPESDMFVAYISIHREAGPTEILQI